ncbi:MAG: cadherin-like domain-containing protein [Xanthomonadales bacterium]|nr:cadherin-like domain-containing protein [Xanthomonadales bacterium]
MMLSPSTQFHRCALALVVGSAVLACLLPVGVRAATITANGDGAGQCSIGDAIRAANSNSASGGCSAGSAGGSDRIVLAYNPPSLDAELVITSNLELSGDVPGRILSGGGLKRIIRVGEAGSAPTVLISDLLLQSGNATGADGSNGGGGGAGLGGALFVYDGDVTVNNVAFTSNQAVGGWGSANGAFKTGGGGGGGMGGAGGKGATNNNGDSGTSADLGGGGGGGSAPQSDTVGGDGGGGAAGGSNYGAASLPQNGSFSGGGGAGAGATTSALGECFGSPAQNGANGGFGGGGGGGGGGRCTAAATPLPGLGGDGGFGGGGGAGGSNTDTYFTGGKGGFGAGGGNAATGGDFASAGSAAGGGGGAGMGGAIFVRGGILTLINSSFTNNFAYKGCLPAFGAEDCTGGSNLGQGKGGAIAVIDDATNTNGNNGGMPSPLPDVVGCGNQLSTDSTFNGADNAAGVDSDNGDTKGISKTLLTTACAPANAIDDNKTVNEDSGTNTINVLANDVPDQSDGSLSVIRVDDATHGTTSFTPSDVSYTPDANYCGPDSFAYTVNGDDTATVSVSVACINDAPTITNSPTATTTEGVAYAYTPTVSDPDGPNVVRSVLGADSCGGSFAGSTYRFTQPGPQPPPSCLLSIQICDGGSPNLCATKSASITIIAVDSGAAIANNDGPITVARNSSATNITVLANDTPDPDDGSLSLVSVGAASHGSAARNGSLVSYTPAAGYCGDDSFTYAINGGDTAVVSIDVSCTLIFANGFE